MSDLSRFVVLSLTGMDHSRHSLVVAARGFRDAVVKAGLAADTSEVLDADSPRVADVIVTQQVDRSESAAVSVLYRLED